MNISWQETMLGLAFIGLMGFVAWTTMGDEPACKTPTVIVEAK